MRSSCPSYILQHFERPNVLIFHYIQCELSYQITIQNIYIYILEIVYFIFYFSENVYFYIFIFVESIYVQLWSLYQIMGQFWHFGQNRSSIESDLATVLETGGMTLTNEVEIQRTSYNKKLKQKQENFTKRLEKGCKLGTQKKLVTGTNSIAIEGRNILFGILSRLPIAPWVLHGYNRVHNLTHLASPSARKKISKPIHDLNKWHMTNVAGPDSCFSPLRREDYNKVH